MVRTLCGVNCEGCLWNGRCKGCEATCGSPFGGVCIAAEKIKSGGMTAFEEYKKRTIKEINELGIAKLPEISELYCLCGSYVNLAYPLPSGESLKILKDQDIYLGTQVKLNDFDEGKEDHCFGIIAGDNFLLVCEYGCEGNNPEIVMYKKR